MSSIDTFRKGICGHASAIIPSLIFALSAMLIGTRAEASTITLDAFGSGSNLAGSGISADANTTSVMVTDTGRSDVFGGDRTTTLNFASGTGANPAVSLNISGGSGHLQYVSGNGNNIATGSFSLLYNGQNSPFPASFSSSDSILISNFSQTNPNHNATYSITLTDTSNNTDTESQTPASQPGNGYTVTFGFSSFSGVDLSNIKSIDVTVSPQANTNLVLDGLEINETTTGGTTTSGTTTSGTTTSGTTTSGTTTSGTTTSGTTTSGTTTSGTTTSGTTTSGTTTSGTTTSGTTTSGTNGTVGPPLPTVPEPASLTLWAALGLGMAGYAARKRRRDRAAAQRS